MTSSAASAARSASAALVASDHAWFDLADRLADLLDRVYGSDRVDPGRVSAVLLDTVLPGITVPGLRAVLRSGGLDDRGARSALVDRVAEELAPLAARVHNA